MARANTIKITKRDGFAWKVVTDVAKEIFNSGVFPLYELHDDDSESLISESDHLNEVLENGGEIGIEVGFTNYREAEELERRIKSHDFYYDYSDDHSKYTSGRENLQKIVELSKFVDRDFYVSLWNKHAPENYKFVNQ